jgi:hypothetical protein
MYPCDIIRIGYKQKTHKSIHLLAGEYNTRISFTQLDHVLGPTGPPGLPGNNSYTANPLYWKIPVPTTITEAIDRIAIAIHKLQNNHKIA